MPKLTQKAAAAQIREYGYSLRKVYGEFVVYPKGESSEGPSAYFAADLEDAVGTARLEAGRRMAARLAAQADLVAFAEAIQAKHEAR